MSQFLSLGAVQLSWGSHRTRLRWPGLSRHLPAGRWEPALPVLPHRVDLQQQSLKGHRLLLKDHMLGTCPWVSGSCSGQPRGDLSAVTGITAMRSPLHLPQWLLLFCFLSFNTTRVHPRVAPGCWGGRCGSAVAALRHGDPPGTGTASFHASTALLTSCITEAWDLCSASASERRQICSPERSGEVPGRPPTCQPPSASLLSLLG